MKIGITCTLKGSTPHACDAPDDLEEEFDKPETIDAIADALRELGHEVETLGDGAELLHRLLAHKPDFAFNFAEGTGVSRSREARVPAVLEMLGIPYSGSDPLTLAVTLDKDFAKRLVVAAGVRTPRWVTIDPRQLSQSAAESSAADDIQLLDALERADDAQIGFPLIVKPVYEGSSKGIRHSSVVEDSDGLTEQVRAMIVTYKQPVLIEQFIPGDEVTVGVVGNSPPQVIGMMSIHPAVSEAAPNGRFVYSLEVKRDYERQVRYAAPPALDVAVQAKLRAAALEVFTALGCYDVARVDFRLDGNEPYFLEVNPLPGLNPIYSDLVILARGHGISHRDLVHQIFDAACRRNGLRSGLSASRESRHDFDLERA